MSGLDFKQLATDNVTIARANAVVELVNQVAALLRNFRLRSSLSQAELAARLGVSQPRIAQLESGKPGNAPSLEQLAEYAFHCGRSVSVCELSQDIPDRKELAQQVYYHQSRVRVLEREVASLTRTLSELESGKKGVVKRIKQLTSGRLFRPSSSVMFKHFLEVEPLADMTTMEVKELAESIRKTVREEKPDLEIVQNLVSKMIERHIASPQPDKSEG